MSSRDRYPTPAFRRTALAPAILATIALLAGVPLIGSDAYLVILFVVAIFALIVAVFAWQAKAWWWLIVLGPIAVLFNPVFPIAVDPDLLVAAHYLAALAFILAGVFIKIRNPEDRNRR